MSDAAAVGGQGLDVLASPVRRDIVDLLANLPVTASAAGAATRARGLTASELGRRLRLHVTTIRFHLDRLREAGLVDTRDERAGVGRPRRHYTVSPGRLAGVDAPDAYRLLAQVLAEAVTDGDAPSAEEAGHRWATRHAAQLVGDGPPPPPATTPGAWLGKVGVLVDVLDRWGYDPEVSTADAGHTAVVELHHCPLRELAGSNAAVACGVHRGVITGTLAALGELDSEVRLCPFVGDDLCVARVTTRTTFSRPEALIAERL